MSRSLPSPQPASAGSNAGALVVSAGRRLARRALARFGVDLGSEHLSHRSSVSVMAEARHVPDDTRHPCRKTDGGSLSHGSRMTAGPAICLVRPRVFVAKVGATTGGRGGAHLREEIATSLRQQCRINKERPADGG